MTAGAVLAGGTSRRMGRDKALIRWAGEPLAARVAGALTDGGCAPVIVVGGDRVALAAATGLDVVADRWPGEGPLGGVLTALGHVGTDMVVAACDLPRLDGATVRAVRAAGTDARPVVARTDRLQASLTWWPAAAAEALTELWARGVRRMTDALAALDAVAVDVPGAVLLNANHPADLLR